MSGGPEPIRIAALLLDRYALAGDRAAQDVADQLAAIEKALKELGIGTVRLPVDLKLENFKKRLLALRPGVVFNLVESLDLSDRLQTIVPLLMEDWRLPFTGSGSAAMLTANHKIFSKRILGARDIPFPRCAWLDSRKVLRFLPTETGDSDRAGGWIIKTLESHASLHLDDSSVLSEAESPLLAERLAAAEAKHGQTFFAERFIDGREFNLSVLENADGEPEVLPVSEINFAGLPAGKPRIVGYTAKWMEESPEYLATPRTFDLAAEDGPLVRRLSDLAVATWRAFGLRGYARVDFRVDSGGRPYVLEANANPALTPNAGFAAAAAQAGMSYTELIRRIVAAAVAGR